MITGLIQIVDSRMKSINPFNLDVIKEFKETTDKELEEKLAASQSSYEVWKKSLIQDRAKLFLKLATVLISKKDSLAKMISQEMGKLYSEAQAEILKCADNCEFYAKNAEKFLKEQIIQTDAKISKISFQPLGTILAIMPWNFPFWQVIRFAAPTLMAGNVAILKHASNVSMCALEIEKLFIEAGFPPHIFQTVLLNSNKIPKLIADKRVKAVTITGSTPAGQSVAENAGKNLKKSVLELGGSDPYIVLEDADIELAVEACTKSRLINAGQSCISAKRFIISSKIYNEFKDHFIEKFKNLNMGDPMNPLTTLSPLARVDLRDELHVQVKKAIASGADLILGGEIPSSPGAFYSPTILENISKDNPAFYEEFFGPVALFFKVKNEKEAIALANDSDFGLGAAVFTKDLNKGMNIATNSIEAGNCFVNSFVKSDPRLPFGGIKQSGYGRELSQFGIYEFVNIKTVSIK